MSIVAELVSHRNLGHLPTQVAASLIEDCGEVPRSPGLPSLGLPLHIKETQGKHSLGFLRRMRCDSGLRRLVLTAALSFAAEPPATLSGLP